MELRFFSIPARDPGAFGEELNRFLRGHRVLQVQRELVCEGGASWWAVCVEYLAESPARAAGSNGKPKVDYREKLDPEQFAVFSRLREVRKELAEKEGVPVYAVFTNEQIAAMVTTGARDAAGLKKIDGVGDARLEKFGEPFLMVLAAEAAGHGENHGKEDGP